MIDPAIAARRPGSGFPDLSPREITVLTPIIALIILLGFFPGPVLDVINPSVAATMTEVGVTDPVELLRPDTLAEVSYAYAASVPPGRRLLFLAGSCPLDGDGAVEAPGDHGRRFPPAQHLHRLWLSGHCPPHPPPAWTRTGTRLGLCCPL